MFDLRTTLLTFLALISVQGSCSVGTLSCLSENDSGKPLICDFFNHYIFNDEKTACIKNEVQNCQIGALPNGTASCFMCKNGYTFDAVNKKCVTVPSDKLVENCLNYSNSLLTCIQCKPHFYMSDGKCESVGDTIIENCIMYKSATECQTCDDGSYLSGNKCLVFQTIQSCHLYRNLECQKCKPKYLRSHAKEKTFNFDLMDSISFDFATFARRNQHYEYWVQDFTTAPCSMGEVPNCEVYKTAKECQKCVDGFYLNSSLKCVQQQAKPIEGCNVYLDNETCMECDSNQYYLDVEKNECLKVNIINACLTYHRSVDKCIECEETHTLDLSGASVTCVLKTNPSSRIAKCSNIKGGFTSNTDQCLECNSGYLPTLNQQRCLPEIDNCSNVLLDAGFGEQHTCIKCREGFYLSFDKSQCIINSVENCKKKDRYNEFRCEICEDLKYYDDGTCKDITNKINCFAAAYGEDSCGKCKPLYWLTDGICFSTNLRNASVIDSNCESNSETWSSSKCDSCKEGFIPIMGAMASKGKNYLAQNHCVELDPLTGNCNQCVENSQGNGVACEAPVPSRTNDCLQMMPNTFERDMDKNCAKCRNSNQMLDKSTNECVDREQAYTNCLIAHPSEDKCQVCKPNFVPIFTYAGDKICAAKTSISNFREIDNCVEYVKDSGKCALCESGFVLSENQYECDRTFETVPYYFDGDLHVVNPPAVQQVENCLQYQQIDIGVTACVACESNYVKIIDYFREKPIQYAADLRDGNLEISMPAVKCVHYSKYYGFESGSNESPVRMEFCDLGVQLAGTQGYACLKCRVGYMAKHLRKFKLDWDQKTLPAELLMFTKCEEKTFLTNEYRGVTEKIPLIGGLPLSVYISATKCEGSSQEMMLFAKVDSDWDVTLLENSFQDKFGIMTCKSTFQRSGFTDIHIQVVDFPNCQIFSFSTEEKAMKGGSDICIACKPGSVPVFDPDSGRISSCQDLVIRGLCESESTMMNGCNKPFSGYTFDRLTSSFVHIDDPKMLQSRRIYGCLIYSPDGAECLMCKKSFVLKDDFCSQIDFVEDLQCASLAAGSHRLNMQFSGNRSMLIQSLMIFLESEMSFSESPSFGCFECKSDYIRLNHKKSVQCSVSTEYPDFVPIENCLQYFSSNTKYCYACQSGFILHQSKLACVDETAFPDCLTVDGANPPVCASCKPDYALDPSGKCVLSNCAKSYKGRCALCKDGLALVEGSMTICGERTTISSSCLAYSPINNSCGKCKNNYILYVFEDLKFKSTSMFHFHCEPKSATVSASGFTNYELDETFIFVYQSQGKQVVELRYLLEDELEKRLFWNKDPSVNPAKNHCWPTRSTEGCKSDKTVAGFGCTECEAGFTFQEHLMTCTKQGSTDFCLKYSTLDLCELCVDTHYLEVTPQTDESPKKIECKPYSPNLGCIYYHPFENGCQGCPDEVTKQDPCIDPTLCLNLASDGVTCLQCKNGYFFIKASKKCEEVPGCSKFSDALQKCEECLAGYWIDSSKNNACTQYSDNPNCATFFKDKDECQVCKSTHYLKDQKCELVTSTVNFCKEYSTDGVCQKCQDGFTLKDNKCERSQIPFCQTQSTTGNTCQLCLPDYYLQTSQICTPRSTDLNCKTTVINKDACATCDDGFKLSGNKCVADDDVDSNCLKQETPCTECKSEYYLDASKKCQLRQAVGCDQKPIDKDECESCLPGFTFDSSSKKCDRMGGISGCLIHTKDMSKCITCDSNNFEHNGNCESISARIANCSAYSTDDKCNTCRLTYALLDNFCDRSVVPNCYRHSSDDSCIECEPGYFLKNSSLCEKYTVKNCMNLQPTVDKCRDCDVNYFLDAAGECQRRDLNLKCQKFKETENKCAMCIDGYYLRTSDETCQLRTNKVCAEFEISADECKSCQNGQWLTSEKKCQSVTIVPDCAQYKPDADECQFCQTGKFLENGKCESTVTAAVENCKYYNSASECVECQSKFYLEDNKCILGEIDRCEVYKSETDCETCTSTHFRESALKCSPYSDDLLCKKFHPSKDQCEVCLDLSYFDDEFNCVEMNSNCESTSNNLCSSCEDGFYLDPSDRLCHLNNAENCEEKSKIANQCLTPADEYWIDSSDSFKAKPVTPVVECVEYSAIKDECIACETVKLLEDGKCIKNAILIPNCLSHVTPNRCSECKEHYRLQGSVCTKISQSNCVKFKDQKCTQCSSGYYLNSSSTCVKFSADLNCAEYHHDSNGCHSCPDDYEKNDDHKCEPKQNLDLPGCENVVPGQTECTKCKDEFYLDASTKKCLARTVQFCDIHEEDKNECSKCEMGYYISGGDKTKCVEAKTTTGCQQYATNEDKCEYCERERFMLNSECYKVTKTVDNCRVYESDGQCLHCEEGLPLVNNTCVSQSFPECKLHLTAEICLECQSTHYLSNSKSCLPYDSDLNCETFNKKENECETCKVNFELNQDKKCVNKSDVFCIEATNSGQCLECVRATHYLRESDAKCVAGNAENCEVFKRTLDECNTCKANHYMDADDFYKCKPQEVENCEKIKENSNTCELCDKGYFLKDDECEPVTTTVTDCEYYKADGQCSQCKSGLSLENNICSEGSITGCDVYNPTDPKKCVKCTNAFYLSNETTCTERTISSNCAVYVVDKDECESCSSLYFKTLSKTCEMYDPTLNCDTFKSNENKCESCSDEYYLDSATGSCKERTAKYCETASPSADECITCVARHWKSRNECKESTTVNFCAKYSKTEDKCEACQETHKPSGAGCVKVDSDDEIEFCAVYTEEGKCQECLKNYFLVGDSECKAGLIPNCEEFISEHICKKCRTGYFKLSDEKCKSHSDGLGCETFNPSADECLTCPQGKELDADNKCVDISTDPNCEEFIKDSTKCNECKEGFILNFVSKACEARTAENCLETQPLVDQCKTCKEEFWMNKNNFNVCEPVDKVEFCSKYYADKNECEKCSENYHLKDNKCEVVSSIVVNCEIYSSASECSKCKNDLVLVDNKCQGGSVANCAEYSSASSCQTCKDGFYLASSQECKQYSSDLNCSVANPSKDECTECADSRYLSSEKRCIARSNSTNCKTAKLDEDKCIDCKEDFYLRESDMTCQVFTASGCDQRHTNKNECITCAQNFFYDASIHKCSKITTVDNCDKYAEDQDLCQFCEAGYYYSPSANVCNKNPDGIENCVEYSDTNQCSKCKANFFLTNNKCESVQTEIANCAKYKDSSSCEVCEERYFLESEKSCTPILVESCLNGYSKDSCKKCEPGFTLKREGDKLICKSSGIQDCVVAIGGYIPTCVECAGFKIPSLDRTSCVSPFDDAGQSAPAKTITDISNCSEYSEVNQCKQCNPGYIRSGDCSSCDKSSFGNRIVSNCESEVLLNWMVCDTCQPGYRKNENDECESCGGNGCAFCENSNCTLCREGFYMNSSGTCILNSGTETVSGWSPSLPLRLTLLLGLYMLTWIK